LIIDDSDVFMLFQKILRKQVVLAVIILLLLVPGTYAQEETAVQTGGSNAAWRIGFWEILHQTFSSDDLHPFYQMTGTNRFKGGKGFFGPTSLDLGKNNLIPNISNKNDDEHGSKDGILTKLFSNIPLLKGLPTFSLEYILPTDYEVGIGLAFAYTNIWLDDTKVRAATSGPDPAYATPLLRMASHFYMFSASLHPFGVPRPDDLDIFLGFGLSRVESTLRYGIRNDPTSAEYATVLTKSELSGSSGTMPFRRMGIVSGGDSFGFMLEFLFSGKNEIIDNPFATNTIIDSTLYDSTYNDRGGALPSKVGMPGGITRFSWTYSF
jgi:hypothetical protein